VSAAPTSVHVIAAASGLLYATSVTTVALTAVLGRDSKRRLQARETLKILLRHPPKR
jgi:phosphate/sulfate permease